MELPNTSAMVGMPAADSCGEVTEHTPARDEDLLLRRQVGAAGLDQRDHREPVLHRDVVGAESLTQRPRIADVPPRTVGSLATIRHSTPLDDADADDGAGADREVGAPRSERTQLEERRVRGRAAVRSARGRAACRACGAARRTSRRHRRAPWRARPRSRRAWSSSTRRAAAYPSRSVSSVDRVIVMPDTPIAWPPRTVRISVVPPPMPRMRMSRYCRLHFALLHVAEAAEQLHGLVRHPFAGSTAVFFAKHTSAMQSSSTVDVPLDQRVGVGRGRRRSGGPSR